MKIFILWIHISIIDVFIILLCLERLKLMWIKVGMANHVLSQLCDFFEFSFEILITGRLLGHATFGTITWIEWILRGKRPVEYTGRSRLIQVEFLFIFDNFVHWSLQMSSLTLIFLECSFGILRHLIQK